jgi:hypothetical protein
MLLLCRSLYPNIVSVNVQRPMLFLCKGLRLLLYRDLCCDVLGPLLQCRPLSEYCYCAEASVARCFCFAKGSVPMLLFCSDYCPDVVVLQGLLSQCCCREEASVPVLLLCRLLFQCSCRAEASVAILLL